MTNEEAISLINKLFLKADFTDAYGDMEDTESYEEAIKTVTEVLKQDPCEDCISRQAVTDALNKYFARIGKLKRRGLTIGEKAISLDMVGIIKNLPLVTPQPKVGQWEYVRYDYNPNIGNWHCSECRNIVIECVNKYTEGGIPTYNYCPNCGSKMIEPLELQGSEEKK